MESTMIRSRMVPFLFLLPILLTLGSGCGSKEQKMEETAQQLQQQAPPTTDPTQALQQMGEEFEKLQNRKPVPPLSFKVLMEFLPKDVSGLKAEKPEGESAQMGEFAFSQATINFSDPSGAKSARVEIFDYAYIYQLYAPLTAMLKMNFQRESTSGYEKSIQIAGYPAYAKWEVEGKNSDCSVLVGDRFWVVVETRGIGEKTAETILGTMNLKGLAGKSGS